MVFQGFSRYVRGVLGGWRSFELLGGYPGWGPLLISGIFAGGVVKQRRFPTSSSRSSCSVELQRNLIFDASYGVILISESLSMEYRGNVL